MLVGLSPINQPLVAWMVAARTFTRRAYNWLFGDIESP